VFYPKLARDVARKLRGYWSTWRLLRNILKTVRSDPDRASYTDIAITPLRENEDEALDLFHATRGGEAALARKRRDEAIRADATRTAPMVPTA